jgi:hypothetical protein
MRPRRRRPGSEFVPSLCSRCFPVGSAVLIRADWAGTVLKYGAPRMHRWSHSCNRPESPTEPARRFRQPATLDVNERNVFTTNLDTSSRFRFVRSSCPAPVSGSNSVRARMSFNAADTSSREPKLSRVPCTNMAGVSRPEKYAVRNSLGRCGGWSGYESSRS